MASLVYRRRSIESSQYVIHVFSGALRSRRGRTSKIWCSPPTAQVVPQLRLLVLLSPLLLDQLLLPFLDRKVVRGLLRGERSEVSKGIARGRCRLGAYLRRIVDRAGWAAEVERRRITRLLLRLRTRSESVVGCSEVVGL